MLDLFMIHSKPFYNLIFPGLPLVPRKIVYFFFLVHQKKVFPKGGIRDLSVVPHLDTSCHTFSPLQHTANDSQKTVEDILVHGRRAAELDSKNPRASDSISRHYFFSGNFDQARQYAQRAVKLNPSYPEAHNSLGQAQVHSGKYAEAEPHFNKAIELNPLDTNAIIYKDGLFFTHMGLGNFEIAYWFSGLYVFAF